MRIEDGLEIAVMVVNEQGCVDCSQDLVISGCEGTVILGKREYLELLLSTTPLSDRQLEHLLQLRIQCLLIHHLLLAAFWFVKGESMSEPERGHAISIPKSDRDAILSQPFSHLRPAFLWSRGHNVKGMAQGVEFA